MRFWGSPKAACYTTTHSPYRLTNEPSKKGHSVLVKYSRKTDSVLSESQASTDQLQPVWQACLCLQPLPPCRHHQWIPSLLNPHTPSCALQGEGQTLRASVCLCLHLPWDQDSNDNMAEVASTQPRVGRSQTLLGGCCFRPGVGRVASHLVCAHRLSLATTNMDRPTGTTIQAEHTETGDVLPKGSGTTWDTKQRAPVNLKV